MISGVPALRSLTRSRSEQFQGRGEQALAVPLDIGAGERAVSESDTKVSITHAGIIRDIRVDVAFDVLDVVSGPASGVFSTDASVSVVTDVSFYSAVVLICIRPHLTVESSTREGRP